MDIDYNEKDWVTPCPKYDCKKTACKCGLEYVNIPTSLGDDSEGGKAAPKNGAYCNALVFYEANGHVYIYTKEGIPTLIDVDASDISTLEQEVRKAQKDVYELREDIDDFIYGFDTVADMKASTDLAAGDIVKTLGYYITNDGGGAYYKITNTGTSNEMDVIAVGDLYANIVTNGSVAPEQLGAYGDGEHDDSNSIQAALDYGKIVEFSPKTYMCLKLHANYPSRKLVIHGNGAILKRPDLTQPPYNYTVAQMKGTRTLEINTDADIKDLIFDNNCFTMWSLSDGYAQEQSASLFINNASTKFNVNIDNCKFQYSAGDGILVFNNAILNITNCVSYETFRGGLTMVGTSEINVDGWNSTSVTLPDGFDVEMASGAVPGKFLLNMNNVVLDYDLDIAIPAGGICNLSNIIMREFDQTAKSGFIFGSGGELNITNSVLRSGNRSVQTIYFGSYGGTIRISDSKLYGGSTYPLLNILSLNNSTNTNLYVDNCKIECTDFLQLGLVDGVIGIYNCDINCESFMVPRSSVAPQPHYMYLLNNKIKCNSAFINISKTNYVWWVDNSVNLYLGNIDISGNGTVTFSGYPKIHYGTLLMEASYVTTLGGGAVPVFIGDKRIITVPSASDLNFKGWVAGQDIAIALDTGLKYQYVSGTTWTQI